MTSEFYESVVLPWNNNGKAVTTVYPTGSVSNKGAFVFSMKNRSKRSKSPCTYYTNSTATFYPLLEGNSVFKLNPGPLQQDVSSTHLGQASRAKCRSARNTSDLTEIKRAPLNRTPDNSRLLSLCLLNAKSVRNKTEDFVD